MIPDSRAFRVSPRRAVALCIRSRRADNRVTEGKGYFMPHIFRSSLLVLFAVSSLMAQRNARPPSNGNTGPGNNPGGSPPPSSTPSQIPSPNQNPPLQVPIFLSGRIVMDDGTPPPTGIGIQRVCSGNPHTLGYTNNKGQFSFQWGGGQPSAIIPDASESGVPGISLPGNDIGGGIGLRGRQLAGVTASEPLLGCELIANAPGYRSDRIDLSDHRFADNPDVGTIVLHRLANVEGTSVSATSLQAPKDARKAWEKGVQLLHKSKSADAEKQLQKAVELYPRFAMAWLDLGRARMQQNSTGTARDAFLKAIDADSRLVDPYLELGTLAMREQNWPDAARYLDRALQLDPVDYPQLWFQDAVADYNVQNYDRAEKNVREALKQNQARHDPHIDQLLGLILINKHDYKGARDALQAYVTLSPGAKDLDQVKAQLSQLESQLAAGQP